MINIFKQAQLEAMQYHLDLALLMRGTVLVYSGDYKYCVDMVQKFGDLLLNEPYLPNNYVMSYDPITKTMY